MCPFEFIKITVLYLHQNCCEICSSYFSLLIENHVPLFAISVPLGLGKSSSWQ